MLALLTALMIAATPIDHVVGKEYLSPGGGIMVGTLTMGDDQPICLGDTTCDFWWVFNSGGQAEFWHTDCDGGGTDCEVMICGSGTDDCTLSGLWTFTGGVAIDADSTKLTLGAAGATDSYLQFDSANLEIYSSGDIEILSPLVTGPREVDADTGAITLDNQETTVASGDGTEISICTGIDSNCILKTYAEADGAGGIDERAYRFQSFNGAYKSCTRNQETLTFAANPGDASKTTSGLIPAGATNIAVTARVLVLGTNCTDTDYGDGSVVDLYGDAIALTVGTTVDPSDYTAALDFNTTAASEVTITGTDGVGGAANCFDLSVRIEAFYCEYSAPTN